MKKKIKIILLILIVVVIALAAVGLMAFRTKAVLEQPEHYTVDNIGLWTEGGNNDFEGYTFITPNQQQIDTALQILSKYEKQLSTERLGKWLSIRVLPAKDQSMELQIPTWVEASLLIRNQEKDEMFNIIFGNDHVQQRDGYTYHPPYYEVEDSQQLYNELSEALNLPELLESARETTS